MFKIVILFCFITTTLFSQNMVKNSGFEEFYNLYYPNGKKIIPINLKDLLTPCGISYWFMDDGTYNKSYYAFSTASFSVEEHNILLDILSNKFDIDCNMQGSKYLSLYIPARNNSNLKFRALIEPYIVPSMKYKLGK